MYAGRDKYKMSQNDWYRRTTWNEAEAQDFFARLKRSRGNFHKGQYLRIQAYTLADTHPLVALELLDQYFALDGDHFDQASAHVGRALAYLKLGNLEAALASYDQALAHEKAYPNVRTRACLELPYLIAINQVSSRFHQALSLLSENTDDLMFPVDKFKHHAARAMILRHTDMGLAASEAQLALQAAALDHSGFRYHAKLGLVSDRHAATLAIMQDLLASAP